MPRTKLPTPADDAFVAAFGRLLAERRESLNKSVADCAAAVGVSRQQWDHWERGKRRIPLEQLQAVGATLGLGWPGIADLLRKAAQC